MKLRLKEMSIESYKSIIEYNPDAIFILSLDGTIVEVNQITTKMLGYSKEELYGRHYEEILVPEWKDFTYQQYQDVLQGKSPEYKTYLFHKNGNRIYLQVKNIPLWENGEIVGIFGVGKDVTELHYTKAILIQMEEWMRALFYSTGEAIDILDLDKNIKMKKKVNVAFEKLYGWKWEELIGEPLPIIPQFRYYQQEVEQAKCGEKIKTMETTSIKKDGIPVEGSLTSSPITDKNGNILSNAGIPRDIIECKQLQKSLKESEERYRKVVELSPKGIIIQRDGIILYANPSALIIVKEKQAIGKHILDYIHPKYHALSRERLLQPSTTEKELPFVEFQLISTDGEIVDVEVNSISINYRGDTAILTIINDISERKKVEQDLHETLKNLADIKKSLDESSIVAITNQKGIIEYVNEKFCEISKYSKEELIGQDHRIINSGFHSKEFFQDMWKTIGQGKTWRGELRNRAKDGSFYWVHTTIVSFLNEKGRPYQYISIRTDITDRKKAEEALKESEKRNRQLVEFSPEAIVVHRDGRIQYANPSCVKLLGASSLDMLIGKPILDFSPPEYQPMVQERIHQSTQLGVAVPPTEEKVIRLDGTIIDVEASGISINFNGKPSYLMVLHDLMERKQVEEALRHSEEKYRFITESMSDLVGVMDETGRVIYASPSHKYVLGLEPKVYEGNLAFDVVHPDDVFHLKQEFDKMIKTKENIRVEFRLQKENGTWVWFEAKGRPVNNEHGNILRFLAVARDITERKLSEETLLQSEERYRLIAENITDFVCIISQDGYFKYASPSHEVVLNFPNKMFEGNRVRNWMHPNDVEPVGKQLQEIIKTKETRKFEFRFRDSQGNWIWFESKATPIFTENGQFKHFLVVSREITERKMYEEKLTHLAFHDTLTGLPNRRLYTDRLEQAIKEAERYERKLAVMFIDMDRFKQINDILGHDVGDELLKQFANRVRDCLREYDILARQGGDEFTVLLPEIQHEKDASTVAQRILDCLQEEWVIGEHSCHTTSSIGIAFYPANGTTRHELLKNADKALYEAKEDGRNNFKMCSLVNETVGF